MTAPRTTTEPSRRTGCSEGAAIVACDVNGIA
jgi:hypothetical protein